MSAGGRTTSRPWEPERSRQDAQSPAATRPEGAVVFFLLDPVPQWECSRFYAPYEHDTRGAPPYAPALMVCLVLSADCVGVFSSRKIALACERHLAAVAIGGQDRPDCRTISDFRTLHLEACKDVFVPVVRLAAETGLVRWGHVSTDGTTMQGHASRHKAMRYGYMPQDVERLRADMEAWGTQAHQQDEADEAALGRRRGDARPAEVEAARQRLGSPRRGKAPKPVDETPDDTAQTNVTGPELHSRRTNTKGGAYGGKAHASVDGACQIIVACDVTDASPDKQQAEPVAPATLATLAQAGIERPQDAAGTPHAIPATVDKGDASAAAVAALATVGFDPSIATGRQGHQAPQAEAPEEPATAQERLAAKLRTPAGQALYARRKGIVAPVFGQSKEARGFRRFLLRGLAAIRGAWRLVCLTHHLLKMWRYGRVLSAASAVWRLV
jgi:transposase